MHVAITSLLLALPRTISSRRMTFAGLKKCVPITDCGREVAEAISSMFSVEVLLARIAPGLQMRSSSPKTCFFSAMPSNTASTTMSALAKSSYFRVGLIRLRRASICSCVKRPRLTEFA